MNKSKKELKIKSQLINMLLKKDEPKPKKEKKTFNLENLFEDDPFPKYVIKENPFDETMNEVKSLNRKIRSKIDKTTKKFKRMINPKHEKTEIKQTNKALRGYTKSYEIFIMNNKDPLIQLKNTRISIANHIKKILKLMKGLKFVETIKVTFEKTSGNGVISKTAYFNSINQVIINKYDIQ